MAARALFKISLIDMTTFITYCVRNIVGKVVTSLLGSYTEKLTILSLTQMLFKVHMKSRTTCKMLDIRSTMQLKLIDNIQRVVLYNIEVTIITITRNEIAILTIPFSMLNTYVLGRNHLAIEHHFLRTILFVILFDKRKNALYKMLIVIIRSYRKSHKLGSLNKTIDTYGEILAINIDITCIEQW